MTPKPQSISKTKIIHYRDTSDDISSSETRVRKAVRHRRRRGETNGYPTKNFLPNFKGPHF
jgi:hypothetical protein